MVIPMVFIVVWLCIVGEKIDHGPDWNPPVKESVIKSSNGEENGITDTK